MPQVAPWRRARGPQHAVSSERACRRGHAIMHAIYTPIHRREALLQQGRVRRQLSYLESEGGGEGASRQRCRRRKRQRRRTYGARRGYFNSYFN